MQVKDLNCYIENPRFFNLNENRILSREEMLNGKKYDDYYIAQISGDLEEDNLIILIDICEEPY